MARDPVPYRAPDQPLRLKISEPPKAAAGTQAVWVAAQTVRKAAGALRGGKALFQLNQKGGVDCPGCAWPDPDDDRSTLGEYCENGAKAIAEEATSKSVGVRFFEKYSIQELAQLSDYELGQLGRLREPLILPADSNHYQAIGWDQAFKLIADQLKMLDNPDEAVFYTSGRTSNEAAFLYQLLARRLGTNNLPDCSNMCHESSGTALSETLGIGKGSVTLQDFDQTDLIVIMGQNPGTNHPRMLTALEKAKQNGAQIITINPLPEAGLLNFKNPQKISGLLGSSTTLTDLFLQVNINGDVALLKAIMYCLWEQEQETPGSVFDTDFIDTTTNGFQEFVDELEKAELESLCLSCGISETKVRAAAQIIMDCPKMIICWAMGLTQHENAVDTIKEIVNLLLLRGSIAKPGAGSCPVRGHSNVQGDRTMGIWEKPPSWFLDNLKREFDFQPPQHHGYNTVEAIKAMHDGAVKIFMGLGGNFHSATPDTDYTCEALQQCELTVQVSTKLNRSHLITGKTALILPCLARTDIDQQKSGAQKVSVENSMGVVHSSQGVLKPVSKKLKSEVAIVTGIAEATWGQEWPWQHWCENYDHIRDLIAQVIPGFEHYNQRLNQPQGFYLPNVAREGSFKSGKAHFSVVKTPRHQLESDEFLMMTVRSHDQFNTTIYGLDDRYRGLHGDRRIVLMNSQDMQEAGLEPEELVDLSSTYERERWVYNFRVIAYDIPSGNIATYFPETNPLVPFDQVARASHTPISKSVKVRIHKQ